MRYQISSGENTADFSLNGAMLTSLFKEGMEYLWQGDARYWAGQAPVCFPICGVLKQGRAAAFGRPVEMKRHGIARISPFSVLEQHKNSITFVQNSTDKTKKSFPFDYELKIRYILTGDVLSNEYFVTNTGRGKLPFVIGGHPAFNCPLCEGETFEDYRVEFDRPMNQDVLRPDHISGLVDQGKRYPALKNSGTLWLRHDFFEENDAMIFDHVLSKCATLIGPSGKGVRLEYQDMDHLLIWSAVGNAPFVALEPWTGISHCFDENEIFENKRGMTILEPDETAAFKFKITML